MKSRQTEDVNEAADLRRIDPGSLDGVLAGAGRPASLGRVPGLPEAALLDPAHELESTHGDSQAPVQGT